MIDDRVVGAGRLDTSILFDSRGQESVADVDDEDQPTVRLGRR